MWRRMKKTSLEKIKGSMATLRLKNGYLINARIEGVLAKSGKLKILKDSVTALLINHPGSQDCIFLEPENFQLISIEDIVEVNVHATA